MADICNKIGIIDRGVMSVNASVADVMKQVQPHTVLLVGVKRNLASAARLLRDHPDVESAEVQKPRIKLTLKSGVEDYSELPSLLVEAGHRLTEFREDEVSLESAFMALTKGMGNKT